MAFFEAKKRASKNPGDYYGFKEKWAMFFSILYFITWDQKMGYNYYELIIRPTRQIKNRVNKSRKVLMVGGETPVREGSE